MTLRFLTVGLGLAVTMVCSRTLSAQQPDTTELRRLREQLDVITQELERLKLGEGAVPTADSSRYGFGPAASKVYGASQGVSIGGYGEFAYENPASARQDGAAAAEAATLDALRAIVYVGYKFSDRMLFNSEVEFEHASTEREGAVALEFAYLDYRLMPALGLRAGLLLSPMGFINELHEPPVFLGTTRPATERSIIPSTWAEDGIGIFGSAGGFAYRAYLMNGFDAVGGRNDEGEGFTAAEGLRGGRQGGSAALAETFGGVARVEYSWPQGVSVGASGYVGQAGQTAPFGASTLIGEAHAQYRARGLDLRALAAVSRVGDAAAINAAKGLTGASSVGERMLGWYLQAGYDVLRSLQTTHQLVPYIRYERLDTQRRVPTGFARDPANDRTIVTLGAAWKPIPNVALKLDYTVNRNEARTGTNVVRVDLGYLF